MQENLNGWEIWQDKGFAEVWAESQGAEVLSLNNVQVIVSKKPVFGYTDASVWVPSLDYATFSSINNFCNQNMLMSLTINSYKNIDGLDTCLTDVTRGTYLLDLSLGQEDLWNSLGPKTRNMVRKGEKNGISVRLVKELSEFDEWHRIYENTGVSKEFPTKPYRFVKNIFESGYADLFCAFKDNVMLSGAFIVHDKKCMMYWLGGFNREYAKFSPNELLHWEIMMYGKRTNYLVYDLGGAYKSDEKGTSSFKKSFGGTFVTLYIYEIKFNNVKAMFLKTKLAKIGVEVYRKIRTSS